MRNQRTFTAIGSTIKKQGFYIAFCAVMVLLAAVLMTGVMLFTNQVYVTDDGETKCFLTSGEDIDAILAENGYDIKKDDVIEFGGFESNTAKVNIIRAYPISFICGGETSYISVTGGTVGDALKKSGALINPQDIIEPSEDTAVSKDTIITLKRVTYKTEASEQPISFETVEVNSAAVKKGDSVVSNPGEEGTLFVTVRKTYVDGKLSGSEILKEEVVKEPVNRVISKGTKSSNTISQLNPPADFQLDENGVPVSYKNVLTGKSAAYSARPGAKTASGRTAMVGYVAVDPKIIPYGTKLYIKSADSKHVYGYAIAADTGTALLDGTILVDLFFPSYESSCSWGIHKVNIYIL